MDRLEMNGAEGTAQCSLDRLKPDSNLHPRCWNFGKGCRDLIEQVYNNMAISNPFGILGTQLKAGLDAVITDILGVPPAPDPQPTFDEVVQYTIDYVGSVYLVITPPTPPDPVKMLELSIVVSDAANGYVNAKSGGYLSGYNSRQEFFIYQLLEGLRAAPSYGSKAYLREVENNIGSSGLSAAEQAPLLMASALGMASFDYWASPTVQELWEPFLEPFKDGGAAAFGFLISATMEAALLSAKRSQRSSVVDTTATIGADAVSVLAAGIGVSAAVVCFQIAPAPAKP
jgi:hypothetical protein